jgi:hypothetical protein
MSYGICCFFFVVGESDQVCWRLVVDITTGTTSIVLSPDCAPNIFSYVCDISALILKEKQDLCYRRIQIT